MTHRAEKRKTCVKRREIWNVAEVLGRVRKAGVGMVELPQMNVEVELSPMDVMDLEAKFWI